MALSTNDFGKAVVASGLMPADALKSIWNALPADARPKNADAFAKLLIKQGKLNEFQSQELLSGSGTPLVLGDLVLLAKIGAGGMGQVFKAQHRHMKRLVAVKLLPAALTKDEATVKRFQREVEAAAKLSHPNIVHANDASVLRGVWYLVMEYVEGSDLAHVVKARGPLPIKEAVNYITQAARGLAFAHGKGVVHRDIKPANLLLDNEGTVKILDMGLARFDDGPAAVAAAEAEGLTQSGQVMGTVDYMAPEQALDTRHADARADIYSLGCSLYRLLTGENVYQGETAMQKLMAHQAKPIPAISTKRSDVPPAVDAVFQRMVAKLPEERYQTMTEVVADLEVCTTPTGSTANLAASQATSTFVLNTSSGKSHATEVEDGMTAALGNQLLRSLPDSRVVPREDTLGSSSDDRTQRGRRGQKTALKGSKGPPWKNPLILAAAGAAGLLMVLLGVWIIVRNKDGKEVARLEVPDGHSVEVQPIIPPTSVGGQPTKPWNTPAFQQWMKDVQAMPAEKQVQAVSKKLMELNPGFDGKVTATGGQGLPTIESGMVTEIGFHTDNVTDISPVRAFVRLTALMCCGSGPRNGRLFDLSPLEEMNLTGLNCSSTQVADLSPLAGMPLRYLDAYAVPITDLSLLEGCKSLTTLKVTKAKVTPAGVAALQKALPNCKIEWDDPAKATTSQPGGDYALEFDGTGYVAIPAFSLPAAGPATLEAYVTLTAKPSPLDDVIVLGTRSETKLVLNGDAWRFIVRHPDKKTSLALKGPLEVSRRIHLAGVKTPNELLLFLDGKLAARTAAADQVDQALPREFTIGAKAFDGIVDEVHISNVARYLADFTPKSYFDTDGNTLALFHCDEGAGNVLMDASGHNHHGKITGAKWVRADGSVINSILAGGSTPPLAKAPFDAAQAKAHQEAWAKHLGTQVETANSVGAKMILIPPGEFLMGSSDKHLAVIVQMVPGVKTEELTFIRNSECPQHREVVDRPLLMGATEVTFGQFRRFVEATNFVTMAEKVNSGNLNTTRKESTWRASASNPRPIADDQAVTQIAAIDAVAFCNWLSAQEKLAPAYRETANHEWELVPASLGYRLPGEVEWEYACRAGTTTLYSCCDDASQLAQYARYDKKVSPPPAAVAEKLPNVFGLYDMHGNASELCHRHPDASHPSNQSMPFFYVRRGGPSGKEDWNEVDCRSAWRKPMPPANRDYLISFRVARTIDTPAKTVSVTPQPTVPATSAGKLFIHDPAFQQWMKDVQALPAEKQGEAVSKKLMELNPGFDGKLTGAGGQGMPTIENGVVTSLGFHTDNVTDVSPVRVLTGLTELMCCGSGRRTGKLFNLSPLTGMKLALLNCGSTQVTDLTPLKGMPLTTLNCYKIPASDVSPLGECRTLKDLQLKSTQVTAAAVATLQKALPNCKIDWDDPAKPATSTK